MSGDGHTGAVSAASATAANARKPEAEQELFEEVGQKVEAMRAGQDNDSDGAQAVDEIESLCMNCHQNVQKPRSGAFLDR